MIKINFNSEVDPQIPIENINNDSIVGVRIKSGIKEMIIMNDIISIIDSNGHCVMRENKMTKFEYLKYFQDAIREAFVFDTTKECFKWMGE
jgi:hypothetical protein